MTGPEAGPADVMRHQLDQALEVGARRRDAATPLDLRIAIVEAAARIVSGPYSSHLIQDPDIAQGAADCFRTVYRAILEAVEADHGRPGAPSR